MQINTFILKFHFWNWILVTLVMMCNNQIAFLPIHEGASSLNVSKCGIKMKRVPLLGDGEEDEEGREERRPSCFDYIMHFLTVFWKVLFACVPPTEYWNGWACFIVSISVIGFLTAIIGDLASHFGCTVGLRDTVTAVVFVALGTSIPGELPTSLTVAILVLIAADSRQCDNSRIISRYP